MNNILTRENARVGGTILFRGRRRIITETCPSGVWLEKKRRCAVHTKVKCECRDFICYSEAVRFGIVVIIENPATGDGATEA